MQATIIFEYLSDSNGFVLFDEILVDLKSGMKIKLIPANTIENSSFIGQEGEFFEIELNGLSKTIHYSDVLINIWILNYIEIRAKLDNIKESEARETVLKEINNMFIQHGLSPFTE
jgi:hypothetical protein